MSKGNRNTHFQTIRSCKTDCGNHCHSITITSTPGMTDCSGDGLRMTTLPVDAFIHRVINRILVLQTIFFFVFRVTFYPVLNIYRQNMYSGNYFCGTIFCGNFLGPKGFLRIVDCQSVGRYVCM